MREHHIGGHVAQWGKEGKAEENRKFQEPTSKFQTNFKFQFSSFIFLIQMHA
jgi:hypothetical protein